MFEASDSSLIFSKATPYKPEFLEMRESMINNPKYKDILIKTSESETFKFHSLLLNDPELQTLASFMSETEEILIPKEIPSRFLPEILHYFYFHEIKGVPLVEIFEFLRVVRFFYLEKLQEDIVLFLKQAIKKNEKELSIFLLFGMLKYQYILEAKDVFMQIIEELLGFFKEQSFDGFLYIFKAGFCDTFGQKTIEVSKKMIEIMKKQKFRNEQIFEFLVIFRENGKKLNSSLDFSEIFASSFDFPNLQLADFERFTSDLGITECNQMKFRVLNSQIKENELQIKELSKENSGLKTRIDRMQEEIEGLASKNHTLNKSVKLLSEEKNQLQMKMEDFIAQSNKDFEMLKQKVKEIDLINHPFQRPEASDKLNLLLFKHFKQNIAKKVVFDSKVDTLEDLVPRITDQRNHLFLFETKDSLSFGVFFSIPLPKPFSEDRFYPDHKAFMFDLGRNEVFLANEKVDKQLRTFKGYVYCVGDSKNADGVEFKDLKMLMVGKRTEQFEGDNLFGFEKKEQKLLERVTIFKIIVEENL